MMCPAPYGFYGDVCGLALSSGRLCFAHVSTFTAAVMVGHPPVKHRVRFPLPWMWSDEGRDVI